MTFTKMAIATLGLLLITGANHATAASKTQSASNPYEFFTDDGYGRKRPCSANLQQKRAEKNPYECSTDDGYGRKRPCSANVKR